MALEAKLNQISRLEAKDQPVPFVSLTNELIASGSTANLNVLAQKVLSEEIPTQVARTVLLHLATSLKSLQDEEATNELVVYLVTLIRQSPSASSYDEADFCLRDWLFSYLCGCEEYTEAARYLSGANLDSTVRVFTDLEKVDIYIKCAGTVASLCWSASLPRTVPVHAQCTSCLHRGCPGGRRGHRRGGVCEQGFLPDQRGGGAVQGGV
jgi:hypothetical protein